MSQHLRVGLGMKDMALLLEMIFEHLVVLDYTVVDYGKFATLIEMRMGILIARFPVSSPAGVTDTAVSRRRIFREKCPEIVKTTTFLAGLNGISPASR
jgi:hypothetical protein